MPFVTAGYPTPKQSEEWVLAMVRGGADIIEIGVPFSDPLADGATVQRTSQAALRHGVTLADSVAMVRRLREQHGVTVPILLMGYFNPMLQYGLEELAGDSAAAGVDGYIVPDLPAEESDELLETSRRHGLDLVFLLAPTSTDERIAQVGKIASGYVYYVSLKGVTGAGHLDTEAVGRMIPLIREHVKLPVGVGFGIRDARSAQAVGSTADAVVIGTRIIQLIDGQARERVVPLVREFLAEIREALDALPAATAKNAAGR